MKRIGAALVTVVAAVVAWHVSAPEVESFESVRSAYRSSDAWLLDRGGEPLAQIRLDYQTRRLGWTSLDDVAPDLAATIISAEDRRFTSHGGVDFVAIAGITRDYLMHHAKRGASTLTMQVAARLDPTLTPKRGHRALAQKWRQMRAAWQIEAKWSKAQILEAYLNLVTFRGEWQGVAATSSTLFGKAPSQLSDRESALLTALLPNPAGRADEVARRACHISPEDDCTAITRLATDSLGPGHQLAVDTPLAPHLAHALLHSGGETVVSTLDVRLQKLTLRALRNQLAALSADQVRDAAAIVLDNATGDVLAYVGSAGPETTAAAVDGVSALRQAGSTLKPFLYGLAFEHELLTPASLLDDSPVALETGAGFYIPENYDHAFRGRVSARAALAGSLNIPAVRTLQLTGLEPFREKLHAFGYRNGLTEAGEYYGYALALGAPEVTLLEQANAYRALANGGIWSPARFKPDDPRGEHERVMSAQAAYLVTNILSDRGAREATFGMASALSTPFWAAAKTGTSKNMRDNWCIGYTDKVTVAVWVGNFEGDPMRNVSGVTGAAPAWLEIISALAGNSADPAPPEGVVSRHIAFRGGVEPARDEWFIDGTEVADVVPAQASLGRPHIEEPQDGLIAALDPDIPASKQHIVFAAANAAGSRWNLDGRDLGAAVSRLWTLTPGHHRLCLVSGNGTELNAVEFQVRGATLPAKAL